MPQIKEYTADVNGLRPAERGVDALTQEGRRIGTFYREAAGDLKSGAEAQAQATTDQAKALAGGVAQVASSAKEAGDQVESFIDHQQISHGAATGAQLFNGIEGAWNDLITPGKVDPNDASVAPKFREEQMEPALQNWIDGFSTEGARQWAEQHAAQFRQHMFEKTAADMSARAGQAVEVNTRQTVNQLSNTVRGDPTSLTNALNMWDSSISGIVGSSPNLKGVEAGKVSTQLRENGREAIVKSAAFGYIQKTGQVPAWATDPKFSPYINGMELKQFEQAAKTQNRTNFLQQKQIEAYQRDQDNQAVHVATNKAFNENVTFDPTSGRAVINPQFFKDSLDVAKKYPNAPNAGATVRTMLDWGEAQQRSHAQPIVSDPMVKSDLMTKMFDPDKPTTKIDILRAEADGKLGPHDGTVMRDLASELEQTPLKGPIYQTAMDAAKERVGETTVVDGHERFANFVQTFLPNYLAQKRAGTLQPNALDFKDPTSLISQSLKSYEPDPAERMAGHMSKLTGTVIDPAIVRGAMGGAKPAPAATARPEVPASLRGIAALEYSPSRQRWRDQASGKIYDNSGKEVK